MTMEQEMEKVGKRKSKQKNLLPDWAKYAIWGVLWIGGVCWFWYGLRGNPLDELALIQRGETTLGFIIDTWEDVEDSDDGRALWSHGAIYTYCPPGEREFTQHTEEGSGRLSPELRNLTCPYPIEVEYLPDRPAISRIKGSGHNNILSWLILRIGLGGLLLILFSIPGIGLLKQAIHNVKFSRLNREMSFLDLKQIGSNSERL